jgi:hypothetical protein
MNSRPMRKNVIHTESQIVSAVEPAKAPAAAAAPANPEPSTFRDG